jgi:putative glutathione S-transferase
MLYTEFDAFIPEDRRESVRPLFPKHLRKEIEEMNEWVYDTVNNGVYKTGFATTQEAYEEHLHALFTSLDRLEKHLEQPNHSPFLFWEHITEADIRLFTTLIRFDVAYVTIFKCNLKMIRYDYPRLHDWLRKVYWDEGEESNGGAFQKTTYFDL